MSDRVAAVAKVIAKYANTDMGGDYATYLARELDAAGLLAPEMQEEWGVEYTGVDNGNRRVEFYPGEDSKRRAEYQFRRMGKMGMNPRLVRRYVTAAEKEEQQ